MSEPRVIDSEGIISFKENQSTESTFRPGTREGFSVSRENLSIDNIDGQQNSASIRRLMTSLM